MNISDPYWICSGAENLPLLDRLPDKGKMQNATL